MKIEIAVPPNASQTERGELFEQLAKKLLIAQSYNVIDQIRLTAVELDLLCKHNVSHKEIYVECKAYRDKPIDANILKNLAGTQALKGYSEAWIVSTSKFGKEAKGFIHEWKNSGNPNSTAMSFYGPEQVIAALESAKVIAALPKQSALDKVGNENLLGEWVLLITEFGYFWAVSVLSGGIPRSAILFYANNGEQVADAELADNIKSTDTSLSKLNILISAASSNAKIPILTDELVNVANVQTGEQWSDYRPSRPKDFVGRAKELRFIFDFFRKIVDKSTETRIFAITGNSGMGKSSLIAKISAQSRNRKNKNKFFVYPIDVRAASSQAYIHSALIKCLVKSQNHGFGDTGIQLSISNLSNPLDSESIKNYIASLEEQNVLVVLIFDQFEELYSKNELYEVFNQAKNLLLNAASVKMQFLFRFCLEIRQHNTKRSPCIFFLAPVIRLSNREKASSIL